MRGTVAKRIRRKVYGDFSQRTDREYFLKRVVKLFKKDKDDKGTPINRTTKVSEGLRRQYRLAKMEFYRGKRKGMVTV